MGRGDAGSLVDEDGEDEVLLVGVGGEVALVATGAVEVVSGGVVVVVEVSEEAGLGVQDNFTTLNTVSISVCLCQGLSPLTSFATAVNLIARSFIMEIDYRNHVNTRLGNVENHT